MLLRELYLAWRLWSGSIRGHKKLSIKLFLFSTFSNDTSEVVYRLLLFQRCLFPYNDIVALNSSFSVRGVCSLESEAGEARVEVLGGRVGKLLLVLPSSWVVLVASSVLPNMVPSLMANMVPNLMANMVANLMANLITSMVASVMTLSISWVSSEHMARLDWCYMGTIGITLAIGSSLAMSKA